MFDNHGEDEETLYTVLAEHTWDGLKAEIHCKSRFFHLSR